MKYFLDTEFLDDGKTIELISIGIVSADNRELYKENIEFNKVNATNWLLENVIPNLRGQTAIEILVSRTEIANSILEFLADDDKIEFWGYFADYDWVLFCQLFGKMIDLPKPFPHYCMDLMQLQKMKGIRIKQENSIHNALDAAKWIKDTYYKIINS